MSEKAKRTLHMLTAKAVARVKGQERWANDWGVQEHMACIRYMALDALADAQNKPTVKEGKERMADALSASLREAFAADKELAYASNTKKLLAEVGELDAAKAPGGGYE